MRPGRTAPRRRITRLRGCAAAAVAATLTTGALAVPAAGAAQPSHTTGGGTALDYPTLRRPFAMPGFKEQEFGGALFVGEGESRFSVTVDLLTKANTVIQENMVPNLYRIGPVSPDGSYYEVQVSSDDRTVTPAKLDALREVIAHPDDWAAADVAAATSQLPVLEQKYAQSQQDKRTILIKYARTGNGALVGSVTALNDDTDVFLEASPPWAEPSTYELRGAGVVGSSAGLLDPTKTGHFQLSASRPPASAGAWTDVKQMLAAMTGKPAESGTGAAALGYHLRRGETVAFTAEVTGQPLAAAKPDQGRILRILDQAKAKLDITTLTGTGITGRATTAMRDAISLNKNYDEKFERGFVMWGLGGGGDDIFTGWDSAWDAITAATVDPGLALEHERDLFDQGGPRYGQLNAGAMHAYAVWRLYSDFRDRGLVETAYPVLKSFFDKMPEWDVDHDGLLESPYGGERIGGRGNHLGLDDSPQYATYQPIPKQGGSGDPRPNTNLTDVALNSYYALFAESLANLARTLGQGADAARFDAVRGAVKEQINAKLWNEEQGLYLNRFLDGSWNPVVTPTAFYPMFGGIATPERARTLVRDHLLNPAEFWGEYAIPSVSRSDPTYCGQGTKHEWSTHYKYFQRLDDESACEEWKGQAWPPMNATVYDGLKRYGFDTEAAQLATKSTAMWLDTWDRDNWFAEYYDQDPGQLISDSAADTAWRTYSWSNLMPLMATHEVIGDEPWGDPDAIAFGTLGLPGTNTVRHVELHGHVYDVSAGPKNTTLTVDGRKVFEATGGRVVVRDFIQSGDHVSFTLKADARVRVKVLTGGKGGHTRQATVRAGTSDLRF